ncbi:cobalt ABC transporter [Streptomyces sp. HNM0575]|uniref:energy-coupling factor ABC transporter permease n=1 Tax=Streptomyces sp. HNM0575 TaxID=2716338 RepID=UPI00145CCC9B|nr:energy-coupling factor ABC transporter permease [Streptomyces sp. HNM0575]NLU75765.1 cobalt ABC transporter [Streptomyces sp. HNM0575]
MHVPDGFIDAPVSVAAGVVAAGAVAVSLRGARRELGGAGGESATGGAAGSPTVRPVAATPGTSAGGERTAPLAGLVAAFIFAVQMLNFPVAAGTSGHLLGGALAAILVGPYTGLLCVSVVLLMQGVLFADGGLTALGVNILDMGVVTVLVAYGIFRLLLRVLPRGRGAVTGASFAAALVSVPAAAVVFTGMYALGGTSDVALGKVFVAMTGVHVLIGIGEAAITAATVGAVVAVRPDLVYGARDFAVRPLQLRTAVVAAPGGGTVPSGQVHEPASGPVHEDASEPERASASAPETASASVPEREPASAPTSSGPAPASDPASDSASDPASDSASDPAPAPASEREPAPEPALAAASSSRRPNRGLWTGGLVATAICAGVISFYASGSPDGLEKVAADNGIDRQAEDHAAKDSPLADYGVESVSDARLSGGLAGVIGAGATLAVGSTVFYAVRRRRAAGYAAEAGPAPGGPADSGQEPV